MESIFFEKQQAALCAQHALNMLLQGPYFSPVELSEIAGRLDSEENGVLAGNFKNEKSMNMDETGFFSIQVVLEALKPFDIDLISIDHPSVAKVKEDPLTAKAFICNMNEHWFTLRKFASQWFALNSTKSGPELLSDMYISIYLHQLRTEGYSIFVVRGILPQCEADDVIQLCPVQPLPPKKKEEKSSMGIGRRLGNLIDVLSGSSGAQNEEDRQLQDAISLSMIQENAPLTEEEQLQAALRLSMEQDSEVTFESAVRSVPTIDSVSGFNDAETMRRKRSAFLDRFK